MWLGDVETSTDTLVPVIEASGQVIKDRIRSELTTAMNAIYDDMGSYSECAPSTNGTSKQRILPEVHNSCAKPKPPHTNGTTPTATVPFNDSSTLSDQRKWDIPSDSNKTNGHAIANGHGTAPSRRNRDVSGANFSPILGDMSGSIFVNFRSLDRSISPQTHNGKLVNPFSSNGSSNGCNGGTHRTAPIDRTMTSAIATVTSSIPSMTSCADGLAPALSEQNLRLLQIVHEHKVCYWFKSI